MFAFHYHNKCNVNTSMLCAPNQHRNRTISEELNDDIIPMNQHHQTMTGYEIKIPLD